MCLFDDTLTPLCSELLPCTPLAVQHTPESHRTAVIYPINILWGGAKGSGLFSAGLVPPWTASSESWDDWGEWASYNSGSSQALCGEHLSGECLPGSTWSVPLTLLCIYIIPWTLLSLSCPNFLIKTIMIVVFLRQTKKNNNGLKSL